MSVRWTLMAVSAVLAVVCVFMICDADGSDAVPASGQCGDTLYWSIDSEKCATFTGSGDMWDYTSADERGWEDCSSVILPVELTHIGNYAFYNCAWPTSVTIPDSVTSIGYNAFDYCTGLASVNIGNSVTSIGSCAFSHCGLTSVAIPDSVTSIGYNAFDYCTGLTSVTIGNSVTSIGDCAFYYCVLLESVAI
ncbi:MAG: leucine-rich repeat domain-containing protein, partial [Candidatus Methanomethylophilus sp.]|nr:leucine-rich repeat domain-containing protein [Methanomethylophilus sp.]